MICVLWRWPIGTRECNKNANFDNIAIVGQNAPLFLRHIEKDHLIHKFFVCDTTEESVDKSFNAIQQMTKSNYFEKHGLIQPAHIEGKVIDEENNWDFEEGSLCLIINNQTLHWTNNLGQALKNFSKSLKPNGAYLGSMFGGETLQELRIAFNLAEGEREGGYSATTSPMMSLTDIGNIFSKSNFNLPTIDKSKILMEFPTMFHLMEFLKINGDQNCVTVKRDSKSPETFLAAASIYQTLFNKMTIPIDELTMNFDELGNNLEFLK